MKIYMTSDLHVDHYAAEYISVADFAQKVLLPSDVLCVAGDTSDDPSIFLEFYKTVSPIYKKNFHRVRKPRLDGSQHDLF